jgi:hypothetical protein
MIMPQRSLRPVGTTIGRRLAGQLALSYRRMMDLQFDPLEASSVSYREELVPVHPYLFVVLECDRPSARGARYGLRGIDEVVIGSGADRFVVRHVRGGVATLAVSIPGLSMGSLHARLLRTSQGWTLEDAGSSNGSYVNGSRVERAVIRDRDVIELGHTLFSIREDLPAPLGTPEIFDMRETSPTHSSLATLLPGLGVDFATLAQFADSPLVLLLLGETGTGKEVVARAMHALSRRTGPFVAVNCGALPSNLVEGQLFGHARGAFSGAFREERGALRAADGGTLLLDEVGDLPPLAQPALLRFLQEGEVTPVGSARACRVDARVIAATHRPLRQLAAEGRFRADLLARLTGFTSVLPPLRDRPEDLGNLFATLLARHAGSANITISPAAGVRLIRHGWPANIRELEQAIVRGLMLAKDGMIRQRDLFQDLDFGQRSLGSIPAPHHLARPISGADSKLRHELMLELERRGGNITDVAQTFGKARTQIYRWMKRLEIDPILFKPASRK